MKKQHAAVILSIVTLGLSSVACAQSPLTEGRICIGGGADFVSDVTIPDGTVMVAGQSFTKTWKLKNSGATSWSGYNLTFVGGDQMAAPSSVSVPMTPPGATVEISVPMTAPKDAGNHQGSWQMTNTDAKCFGQDVFVLIDVKSSAFEGRKFEEWERDLHADSPAVREKALEGLSRFGSRATPALIKIFHSDADEKFRGLALAALADIRPISNEAIQVLLEATADPSPSSTISFTAVLALQEVLPSQISPEAIPTLIKAMHDVNPITRQLAIRSLVPLGPAAKKAMPTLHELADHDPESVVRNSAKEALKLIEQHGVGR